MPEMEQDLLSGGLFLANGKNGRLDPLYPRPFDRLRRLGCVEIYLQLLL
jgi:hypothetical protein